MFDEAKKLGIGFYIGYAELTPEGRRFNTAILVGPDGSIVGKYRKVHLPGHAEHKPKAAFQHLEKKYFEVGDLGFRVWRYLDTITGMLICNDRRWPEAFRVLALQGAEIVALGFNTPSENLHYPEPPALRVHHHLIMAQSMAFQNATWLVETAKAGHEDGFRMFGHSVIVAPTGEIAAKSQSEEDEVDLLQLRHRPRREPEEDHVQFRRAPPPGALPPDRRARGGGSHAGERLVNKNRRPREGGDPISGLWMDLELAQLPALERYKLLIGLVIPRPIALGFDLERERRRQLRAVLLLQRASRRTRRSASSASTGAPTARSSTP